MRVREPGVLEFGHVAERNAQRWDGGGGYPVGCAGVVTRLLRAHMSSSFAGAGQGSEMTSGPGKVQSFRQSDANAQRHQLLRI